MKVKRSAEVNLDLDGPLPFTYPLTSCALCCTGIASSISKAGESTLPVETRSMEVTSARQAQHAVQQTNRLSGLAGRAPVSCSGL